MKQCMSFVLSLLLILSVFGLPVFANAQTEEVVDVSFREMEKLNDLNKSNLAISLSTQKFTQGKSSLSCTVEQNGSTGNLMVFFYRLGQGSNPVDISGATYMTMDLWVPADGYFDTIKGDAGVRIDDADNMNKWGSTGGSASAANVKTALKGLKAGWNFVAIPLDKETACQNAVDIRFHVGNSGVAAGSVFYIDDLRFVNDAALSEIVPDRNAAKAVVGMFAEGQTAQAQAAYQALLHRERVYVPADILTQNNVEPISPTVQYTVRFDLDGGVGDIPAQNVYVGDTLRAVSRPEKEGYAFGGWYISHTKYDLETYKMPAKDITFTAKWVTPVTVSFDVNGGKTEIASQVLPEGASLDPVENPRRGGHRFDGWYLGDTKIDLETYVVPSGDVTLTAKWLPYRYFLKFNSNGGTDVNPYQVVECAAKVTPPVTPTKEGYVFDGWYQGSKKVDFETFLMPDADVTLNAKWKRGEETVLKFGNVNTDTAIDAKDALELLKCAVNKTQFNADQTFYGDVNADTKIDAKDALEVLKFAVQKISGFSAAEHYATYTQPLPPAQGPIYPGDPVPEPGEEPSVDPQPDDPNQKPDQPVDPQPTPVTVEANIMTFNIRQSGNNNELDGDNGWLNRKDAVMQYINNSGADVICLQEVRKSQSEDITAALSSTYKGEYKGRENIANPEGLMTLYNAEKYELVSKELFWLSDTPDVASKGWGANYYRICLVLTLKEKAGGNLLNVFNVHLDHQVEEARVNGLKLVMERMNGKQGHSIVAGDFNTTSASGCYNIIANVMTDTSTTQGAKVFSTCQEFGAGAGNQNGSPIDFIFVDKENTALKSYRICNDTFTDQNGTTRNYSDHYAVQSVVTFTYQ